MAALRENFKADNFKYLLCDAHKDGTRAVVNFNIQNRKNEWSGLPDSSSTHSRVSETSATPDIKINTLAQQEKDIAEAESSTLRIQKYCLTEYIQNPETIFEVESFGQGSIAFTLPKGRTVLRFAIGAQYISNIDLVVAQSDDLIQFGALDKVIPYAAELPFSWELFGQNLIDAVRNIVASLGDAEKVKESFRHLSSILMTSERKEMWDLFRKSFYRLASEILGDSAIPEDLGALRLIFHDSVPSLGPQPFFPQVKTGFKLEKEDEEDLLDMSKHLKGISGKLEKAFTPLHN